MSGDHFRIYVSPPEIGKILGRAAPWPSAVEWVDDDRSTDLTLSLDDGGGPIRLGRLIDWIMLRMRTRRAPGQGQLAIAHGVIDLVDRCVRRPDGRVDRLTDREVDFLAELAAAPKQTMTREAILAQVWGYVSGLETHTLETHIYRLRQKIEDDPRQPKVLVTTEGGYGLVIEGS
jgi:DNA-binding response OmpR family regulator